MLPPAPPRLSTTTCHPTDSLSLFAINRERMSVPPPGGNGTIILIGRDGYEVCAEAASADMSAATIAKTLKNLDALILYLSFRDADSYLIVRLTLCRHCPMCTRER